MAVTIELQNLGDAQLCRDITATWSTRSVGDKASGACRLPDRARRRTGTCEWKDPMDLNGRILSRLPPVSTSSRLSRRLF